MKQPMVSKLLTVTLYLVFVAGVLLIVTLPFMLEYYTWFLYDAFYLEQGYRTFILIFLIVVGVWGLWIVWELIRMLRTIPTGPFVDQNTRALRRIGVVAMGLAVLFFAKCFYYITILTLGCGFLLVICSMFAFTLASLFRQAVELREENDLTI